LRELDGRGVSSIIYFAVMVLGSQLSLAADRLPVLDVENGCRSSTEDAIMGGRNSRNCLDGEGTARAQLAQSWGQFSSEDKGHCVALVQTGGQPSYVELQSCLEMSRDARNLSQDLRNPAPPKVMPKSQKNEASVENPRPKVIGRKPAPAQKQPAPWWQDEIGSK
jgi:hypothetical protein